MKKSLITLISLISLSIFVCSALAQEKNVSLSYVSYPPFYGKAMENGGPITEIIVQAFKVQGYQVKLEQLPWSRALEWTKEGKYDGIYSAWFREDREEFFVFSDPLPANEIVLFKHKNKDITHQEYADL